MIAVTFVPARGVGRGVSSLVHLLVYFSSPKPGLELHFFGERLLCKPRTAWIGSGPSALRGPRTKWARDMAQQLKRGVQRSRKARGMPLHLYHHVVFSFHPKDTSRLGSTGLQRAEMAIRLCRLVLNQGGLDLHPAVLAVHGDRAHLHVHVAIASTSLRGTIWSPGRRTFRRLDAALADIEARYSLVRVEGRRTTLAPDSEAPGHGRRPDSTLEAWREAKTGLVSSRELIRRELDACLSAATGPAEFAKACRSRGIEVLPRIEEGRIAGISFRLGESVFSGSRLGTAYAWPAIRKRIGFKEGDLRHREIAYEWCRSDREGQRPRLCIIMPAQGSKTDKPTKVPRSLEKGLILERAEGELRYLWQRSRRLAIQVRDTVIVLARPTLNLIRLGLALAAAKGWGALRILAPGFAAPRFEQANKRAKKKMSFERSPFARPQSTPVVVPIAEVDVQQRDDTDVRVESADPGDQATSRYREEARARSRGPRRPGYM